MTADVVGILHSGNDQDGTALLDVSTTTWLTGTDFETGDLLLTIVHGRADGTAGSIANAIDGGQTWTAKTQVNRGTTWAARPFVATFDGTWDADPTFTIPAPSTVVTAFMLVVRGHDGIDVDFTGTDYADTASPTTIAQITTLTDDALVLVWLATESDTTTFSSPSNCTFVGSNQYVNTSGDGNVITACEKVQATAGATGAFQITSSAAIRGYSFKMAVKPAAASSVLPLLRTSGVLGKQLIR